MSLIIKGSGAFLGGALYPLRALRMLVSTPKLRGYVLIPIAINLLLGITIYAGLLFGGLRAIDTLIADIPNWTATLPRWANLPAIGLHLPHVTLPAWMVPHWTLPSWNLPDWNLPDWNLPAWNLPTWQLPAWITLPNWVPQFPDFEMPSLPQWRPSLPNWIAGVPGWLAIALIWLLRVVLTVVLLIVTGFIVLQFGVLLCAPWYGKLSEELERLQTGNLGLVEVGLVGDIWRAIVYELKKLVIGIAIGIPLLVLNFFPGVGTAIATLGGIGLAATIVCLDFLDSALERRRLSFRQKLSILWRTFPASASFALVCLGLVSIPLVNLIAIPICVAAGTLFFCDRVYPWLEQKS